MFPILFWGQFRGPWLSGYLEMPLAVPGDEEAGYGILQAEARLCSVS